MTNLKELKVGSVLSETQYYTVEKIQGDNIQIKTESDESVVVNKDYLETFLISADQYSSEQKMNSTELAEVFSKNSGVVMTCSFQKQVKEGDVIKEIEQAVSNTAPKALNAGIKSAVKKALEGEERIIVGRHTGAQDGFGRYHFTDMLIAKDGTKSYDVRQRLVDPRTINYIIVRGVKYSQK